MVPPLPLQGIVVSSLVSASKVARSLILVLEVSNIVKLWVRVRVRVRVKVKVKSLKSKLDPEVGSVMG